MKVSFKVQRGSYGWHRDVFIQLKAGTDFHAKSDQLEKVIRENWTSFVVIACGHSSIPPSFQNKVGLYRVQGPGGREYHVNTFAKARWPSLQWVHGALLVTKVRLHLFLQGQESLFQVFVKCGTRILLVGGGMAPEDQGNKIAAIVRECKEETGILLSSKSLQLWPKIGQSTRHYYWYGHVRFRGQILHSSVVIQDLPTWYPTLRNQCFEEISSHTLRAQKIDHEVESIFLVNTKVFGNCGLSKELPKRLRSGIASMFNGEIVSSVS